MGNIRVAGAQFETEKLEPFGERWKPTESGILVDEWVNRDIVEVSETIREKQLVVMSDTRVSKHWQKVPPSQANEAMHTDPASHRELFIHMLHSADGQRWPTSYTLHRYLKISVKKFLPLLRKAFSEAPRELYKRYCLDVVSYQYFEEDEPIYSLSPDPMCVFWMLQDEVSRLHVPRKDDPRIQLYKAWKAFYMAVSADVKRYIHRWEENPGSTVFAYQDTAELNSTESLDNVVFHRREDTPADSEIILGENFPEDESYLGINLIMRDGNHFELAYPPKTNWLGRF